MRRILFSCFLWVMALVAFAQSLDSLRISLLTCSPGKEVYALYGHTAIRCQNYTRQVDVVFNYGVFSFEQPNFLWRFLRGQCDYMVDVVPWDYFVSEYENRGSSVTAQVLNLTPEEANELYAQLCINVQPENCEYRYNFLYNNCTTMVRDMIERAVNGTIVYPDGLPKYTYRKILHQYTSEYPWEQEGNDMLLGAAVDTLLSDRAAMFAPEYLMQYAAGAVIRQDDNAPRKLIASEEILVQKTLSANPPAFPLSPLQFMLAFLGVCLLVLLVEYAMGRMAWAWDVLLLLMQGMAGLLVAFLYFFSEHPAVDSNWQLWVVNPLALFGIPLVVRAALRRERSIWHPVYFTVLTLFIVFSPWIPQDFGNIIVPLALCLLTRPISYYLYYRKKKI